MDHEPCPGDPQEDLDPEETMVQGRSCVIDSSLDPLYLAGEASVLLNFAYSSFVKNEIVVPDRYY